MFVGNRGPLHDRDNTRSSPLLSLWGPLRSLKGGDERGKGQGCYLS
jgi:hypothetical protein